MVTIIDIQMHIFSSRAAIHNQRQLPRASPCHFITDLLLQCQVIIIKWSCWPLKVPIEWPSLSRRTSRAFLFDGCQARRVSWRHWLLLAGSLIHTSIRLQMVSVVICKSKSCLSKRTSRMTLYLNSYDRKLVSDRNKVEVSKAAEEQWRWMNSQWGPRKSNCWMTCGWFMINLRKSWLNSRLKIILKSLGMTRIVFSLPRIWKHFWPLVTVHIYCNYNLSSQ